MDRDTTQPVCSKATSNVIRLLTNYRLWSANDETKQTMSSSGEKKGHSGQKMNSFTEHLLPKWSGSNISAVNVMTLATAFNEDNKVNNYYII